MMIFNATVNTVVTTIYSLTFIAIYMYLIN